jgi:hypothetical protein
MLLKTYSIPVSDKKLIVSGMSLVLFGILGLAGAPAQAVIDGTQPLVITNGSTVSWTGPAEAYVSGQNANGNVLHICLETVATCTLGSGASLTAVRFPTAGSTSLTVAATDNRLTLQGDPVVALGEGTFKVQMVAWTNGTESTVGSATTIVVSNSPAPSSGGSGSWSPPAPPLSINIQVAAPAASLVSGNREFSFASSNTADVQSMTIDGKAMPILNRKNGALKVRLPMLKPGTYSVTVKTESESWVIPNAITIGELPAHIQLQELDESFEKYSSELPGQTKQQIRDLLEQSQNLKTVTVFAIARREIIGDDRNKLARSRAESAYDYIKRIDQDVTVKTQIIHYTEVDLTSRGLFFQVTQKKQPE